MKVNAIISLAASMAVVMMAASCQGNGSKTAQADAQGQEEAVTAVTTAQAVIKEVPQTEVYSSTVEAYAVNNIAPQSSARIKKINVEVGDFVSKGQILAVMDDQTLTQQKLKLVNDSTELSRLEKLYHEGGVSKSDYEASELSYKVAKSTYENLLENTVLRSPLTGVISARNYDRGDMYSMGQAIFVVQQITPVKILVAVSESDYSKVKKGDLVSITADALPGETFTGKVVRLYPTIDASSHTFQTEVVVTNADRKLRPGMYTRSTMTFGVNNSVVIPDGAIVKQQGSGQRMVYVVNSDDTVSSKVVTLGRHIGSEYEILEGVSEGDEVVVKGQTALRNGAKVSVVK